ncbi:WIAG-tail domain [Paenibacillus sp. 843]|uniref:WIAG-tail domain n=1 Tax=Paenibacillus sp. 843 TaxID=3341795 RepID=UPI00372CCA7F
MNKARRMITRGRGKRPYRRYPGRLKTSANRTGIDRGGTAEYELADDTIDSAHLRHRSVRSEAIEDYSVYSIHLSPESITSSKIASHSVDLAHLSFNPVQGMPDRPLMQQFGDMPFMFPEGVDTIDVAVSLPSPYADENYVMVVSCSDPGFQAGVRSRNELQAMVGITRSAGNPLAAGWLSWIAIGGQ